MENMSCNYESQPNVVQPGQWANYDLEDRNGDIIPQSHYAQEAVYEKTYIRGVLVFKVGVGYGNQNEEEIMHKTKLENQQLVERLRHNGVECIFTKMLTLHNEINYIKF